MKAAFIGLGVMGYPMAGHLAAKGHHVTVWNRTSSKAKAWITEHNGAMAASPAEAAVGAEIICLCVGDERDVQSVTLGDNGVFEGLEPGAILVDHTTSTAGFARELAELAAGKQAGSLDAPISGGQVGAENGALTIMVGGSAADYEQARPVMEAYAKAVTHMGSAGSGQLTKMVNQICIAGLVQGLSEGLRFSQNAGLDGKKVLAAISGGAAGSWQMSNRGSTMIEDEFDFGFAVDWMRKDLRICLAEAKENGSDLPVTQIVDEFYAQVQAANGNRWDTSSLITRLPKCK